MKEINDIVWYDIPGYEGSYKISKCGQIKSIKFSREIVMKQRPNKTGGYNQIYLEGRRFYVHQLMCIFFMGFTPNGKKMVIDHIDSNKLNNSIDNLRIVTHRFNTSRERTIKKGLPVGVSYHKLIKKYQSSISINGKSRFLGYFNDIESASLRYEAELKEITKNSLCS